MIRSTTHAAPAWWGMGTVAMQDVIALRTRARLPLNDKEIDELGVPQDEDIEEVRMMRVYQQFLDAVQGNGALDLPKVAVALSANLSPCCARLVRIPQPP